MHLTPDMNTADLEYRAKKDEADRVAASSEASARRAHELLVMESQRAAADQQMRMFGQLMQGVVANVVGLVQPPRGPVIAPVVVAPGAVAQARPYGADEPPAQ